MWILSEFLQLGQRHAERRNSGDVQPGKRPHPAKGYRAGTVCASGKDLALKHGYFGKELVCGVLNRIDPARRDPVPGDKRIRWFLHFELTTPDQTLLLKTALSVREIAVTIAKTFLLKKEFR